MTKNKSNLGMFDFAKGYGLCTIVFIHVLFLYPAVEEWAMGNPITRFLFFCYTSGAYFYYLIYGYTLRPIEKSKNYFKFVKKSALMLLGPYFCIMLVQMICQPLILALSSGYFTIKELGKNILGVLIGFLVGSLSQDTFHGISIVDVNLAFVFGVFFLGSIITEAIICLKKRSYQIVIVLICAALAVVCDIFGFSYFYISSSLYAVPVFYVGYLISQAEWLPTKVPIKYVIGSIVMLVVLFLLQDELLGDALSNVLSTWPEALLSVYAYLIAILLESGVGIVMAIAHLPLVTLSVGKDNRVIDSIRYIGARFYGMIFVITLIFAVFASIEGAGGKIGVWQWPLYFVTVALVMAAGVAGSIGIRALLRKMFRK